VLAIATAKQSVMKWWGLGDFLFSFIGLKSLGCDISP